MSKKTVGGGSKSTKKASDIATSPLEQKSKSASKRGDATKKKSEKVLDSSNTTDVSSLADEDAASPRSAGDDTTSTAAQPTVVQENAGEKTMQITITRNTKERKGSGILFNAPGRAGAVRFPKTYFDETAVPDSLVVDGNFAEAKTPKRKLTKEERAALPKPTAAERIAKAEARLAALKAKASREQASELKAPATM